MTILRIALSVFLAGVVVLLGATPAFAHTELTSSDPADGASLSTAPTRVTLTFEEAVTLPADPISVVGPDGAPWTVGQATVSGASVTAPVQASGPAGPYTLRYTVVADDGDSVSGTVRFALTADATPTATAVATAASAADASTEATVAAPATVPTAAPEPVRATDDPADAAGTRRRPVPRSLRASISRPPRPASPP